MPEYTTERSFVFKPKWAAFGATLGVGLLAGGVYYFSTRNKDSIINNNNEPNNTPRTNISTPVYTPTVSGNDGFPLKKGSKGARVRQLQQALSARLGSSMKQYTSADGDFGGGTEKALRAAGYPLSIDESTFNTITASNSASTGFNPSDLANEIFQNSTIKSDIDAVIGNLRQLNSVSDYTAVNNEFKTHRYNLARTTVVTYLLGTAYPTDESARQRIMSEFIRMGLKHDIATGKWSLSGLGGFNDVVTLKDTVIMDTRRNRIPVKRNTILGDALHSQNGYTVFRALDGTLGLVATTEIKDI